MVQSCHSSGAIMRVISLHFVDVIYQNVMRFHRLAQIQFMVNYDLNMFDAKPGLLKKKTSN